MVIYISKSTINQKRLIPKNDLPYRENDITMCLGIKKLYDIAEVVTNIVWS